LATLLLKGKPMSGFRKIHGADSSGLSWIKDLGTIVDDAEGFPFYFGREDPRPIVLHDGQIAWHEYDFALGTMYTSNLYMKLFEYPEGSLYVQIFKYDDQSHPVFESKGNANEEFTTTLPDSLYRMRIIKERGTPSLADGTTNYNIALHAYPVAVTDQAGGTVATAYPMGDLTSGKTFAHTDNLYVLFHRNADYFQDGLEIDDRANVFTFDVTKAGILHVEFTKIDGVQASLDGPNGSTLLLVNSPNDVKIIPGTYYITIKRDFDVELTECYKRYEITASFKYS
jgi:hypothetical protein